MAEVIFTGPEGKLEGRITRSPIPKAPAALFLAPHPQHGGTMNNKVIYTLFHAFARRGFSCLRFNYRGVGKSAGSYAKGEGELADAASAVDFLSSNIKDASQVWIVGFSFGAWIALQLLMRRPDISHFVAVAPPVNMFDFNFLSPCPEEGLIIQGLQDEIVPAQKVSALHQRLVTVDKVNVAYKTFEQADHFFKNHLQDLDAYIGDYLLSQNIDLIPSLDETNQ